MDEVRAKQLLEALATGANALIEIARVAGRNGKSLSGSGPYATRFHDEAVKVHKVDRLLQPVLREIDGLDAPEFARVIGSLTSPAASLSDRESARRALKKISEVDILPSLAKPTGPAMPKGEPVLPMAVLATAPSYLQRTLIQANGCYENRWFEASSVMIRKLVENLIIDVYEKHGKSAEIQKDGEYFMLAGLVNAILSQAHWKLQRETTRALPELKKLGDRAAHNRRYWATQQDIDKILSGLRATVDDLLHLAGHK
jgi:hypothetical protein